MAYFTYVTQSRELTEAELASVNSYVAAQVTAGTTDGNRYNWPVTNSETGAVQLVRMWGTSESATGYQAVFAGFNPAVSVSVY